MNAVFINNNQSPDFMGMALARGSGPYKLSHQLRKFGYSAQVIDFVNPLPNKKNDVDWKTLSTILTKYITEETKILGFSMTFWGEPNIDMIKQIMVVAKQINPNIHILIGGAVTTYRYLKGLEKFIDGIVSGYAENLIVELMDFYNNKTLEPEYSYAYDQTVKVYEKSRYNHYDFANCDFLFHESDRIQPGEALGIELSRGCIFKCKFCDYQYLGKKKVDYIRDLSLVKKELEHNWYNYGTLAYNITDSTFNESSEKLLAFAEMVESLSFRPNFNAFIRPDLLCRNPETIEYLERANFTGVFFGLETLNKKNAMLIGKGWNGTIEAKPFLEKLAKRWHNRINIHANMIVGLPYEDEKSIFNTKNYLSNIGIPSWYFTPLYIRRDLRFATSEFDRNYTKYGYYFDDNDNWYHKDGYWNQQRAFKISNAIYKNERTKRVIPFFWYAPFISSKTHTIEELLTIDSSELRWRELTGNQQKFLKSYYNSL